MSFATLNMPRLGETMEQGEIVTWLVAVGEPFTRGQAILEVETDKTLVEYPALGGGVLVEMLAGAGDTVDVGTAIARVDLGGGTDWTLADTPDAPPDTPPDTPPDAVTVPADAVRASLPPRQGTRLRATPVARRLARRAGIDLGTLTGTGRRGRIEATDVVATDPDAIRFAQGFAYVDAGPKNGPPVLLIHGFAGDHTTFAQLANGLRRAGARVVACDLPGHGATQVEATTTGALSDGLAAFARAVFGDAPLHLVTHSLGVLPGLNAGFNLASASLIAPVGLSGDNDAAFLTGMASPESAAEVAALLARLSDPPPPLSDHAIKAIYSELARGRLGQLAHSLMSDPPDIRPALARLARDIPLRLLLGRADRIARAPDLTGLPPEIAVHTFADTGHMPHWEHPRAVLNILTTALAINK